MPLHLAVGLAVWLPRAAEAQTVAEQAAAEALFRDARQLQRAGKISKACAKFAESQRLDPKIGTLLNLASCHEKEGKTASAWAEFTQAIALADKAGQELRASFARTRAAELEARLSRVLFRADSPPEDLRIKIGDKDLGAAALGSSIPFDPGKYAVEVTAPGKKSWTTEIEVKQGASTQEVAIPPLADEPASVRPQPRPSAPAPAPAPELAQPEAGAGSGAVRRTLGFILGGVGIVGIGAGAYFGIRTFSQQSVVEDNCSNGLCNREGFEADEDAHRSATISTIAIAAGATLAVGGFILILTSGSEDEGRPAERASRAVWIAPRMETTGAGFGLGGVW